MTTVTVNRNSICIHGHAGYAPRGQDIVCSAVTALVQTLIKSFESFATDKITYEISDGRADIHFGNLTEAGRLLVDSFFIGICMIADEFGDYIKIY